MERLAVTGAQDWESLPKTLKADAYPGSDAEFYKDWSWDRQLGQ